MVSLLLSMNHPKVVAKMVIADILCGFGGLVGTKWIQKTVEVLQVVNSFEGGVLHPYRF